MLHKKASQLESQYYSYSLSVVYSNLDLDVRFMWTIHCSSHTAQEIVMIIFATIASVLHGHALPVAAAILYKPCNVYS